MIIINKRNKFCDVFDASQPLCVPVNIKPLQDPDLLPLFLYKKTFVGSALPAGPCGDDEQVSWRLWI